MVVDAAGQRKRTRPLAGVNGEVCKEKRKKLWKERKKDLTRASIVRDGRERHIAHYTGVSRTAMPQARHSIYYAVFQESSVAVRVASQLTTVAAPEEIGGGCGFAV